MKMILWQVIKETCWSRHITKFILTFYESTHNFRMPLIINISKNNGITISIFILHLHIFRNVDPEYLEKYHNKFRIYIRKHYSNY